VIYIFVDLEMHAIAGKHKEEKTICNREVIEIGAVMLDEELKQLSTYKRYVKPEYNTVVYNNIRRLTGITWSRLASADSFRHIFPRFVEWCESRGTDYKVFTWSNADRDQVTKELRLKNMESYDTFLDRWEDFQREYSSIIGVNRPVNLEKALNIAGIPFEGEQHDALMDAENTAELYRLTRDTEAFKKSIKEIKSLIDDDDEPLTSSLGSMFDFDSLMAELSSNRDES